MVAALAQVIPVWADKGRGKLAEYAVQAVALVGTDRAMMVVDDLSVRYRSKIANVGAAASDAFAAAAERRGLSVDQLGDRVVPSLGFTPGQDRTVAGKAGPVAVRVGLDGKLVFVAGGKRSASVPSGLSADDKAALKTLAADLRAVLKPQTNRHERMLVAGRTWPAAEWTALYPGHPLLRLFAVRCVWSVTADGTRRCFRLLDDGTACDADDHDVALPSAGTVELVHPLALDPAELAVWRQHLADHEVAPPFPQLDRPVHRCPVDQASAMALTQATGQQMNGMTFKGRAERRGWLRSSVMDGGMIADYRRIWHAHDITALLGTDGMHPGMGMDESISLGDCIFLSHGTTPVGNYRNANRGPARQLPLGDLHPIVYSEAVADLLAITGAAVEPDGE